MTGPDGSFVFENLPGGTYTLTASGYAPVASVVQVGSGGVTTADVEFPAPAQNGAAPNGAARNGGLSNGAGTNGAVGTGTTQNGTTEGIR